MGPIKSFLTLILSLSFWPFGTAEGKSGCCSWHSGVCGSSCCDGTRLSQECGGTKSPIVTTRRQSEPNRDYIDDEGQLVVGDRVVKRYSLNNRYWYESTSGRPSPIFIDIEDTTAANGYCNGGTRFRRFEKTNFLWMKCFNENRESFSPTHRLLVPTKQGHLFEPGNCDNGVLILMTPDDCRLRGLRWPAFYNKAADAGDHISEEECRAIVSEARNYKWDICD